MKVFVVFASVILAAHGASVKQMGGWSSSTPAPTTQAPGWSSSTAAPAPGWSSSTAAPAPGWSSSTAAPAPGWPSTAAPTTQAPGWPAPTTQAPGWPAPTTAAPGWPAPAPGWQAPAQGWSGLPVVNTQINLAGEAAAVGSGWATENHAENIAATGDDYVPADISMAAGGESVVAQALDISQQTLTNGNDGTGYSSNYVAVENLAGATEGAAMEASGLAIAASQNGYSAGSGIGALASDAQSNMSLNPGSIGWSGNSNMGLSHN